MNRQNKNPCQAILSIRNTRVLRDVALRYPRRSHGFMKYRRRLQDDQRSVVPTRLSSVASICSSLLTMRSLTKVLGLFLLLPLLAGHLQTTETKARSHMSMLGNRASSGLCTDGFNDELIPNPKANIFYHKIPREKRHGEAQFVSCTKELAKLPVVTSNDAYRLGNAVERQGIDWIGARRLVLEDSDTYKGSILYNFLLGGFEEQRAFVSCVVAHKQNLEGPAPILEGIHGDNNTIVLPLRLSDKVRFMVEDYPVMNRAILDYKRVHCPWCNKLVIMTLLVWGEDKNHMFAYSYDEYKQSLSILHAVAKTAQSKQGGSFQVMIRSTLDADNDFVFSAYSPHLILPMVTPSSWHRLLTYCNRAVFNSQREGGLLYFFDRHVRPMLKTSGRREQLLSEYLKLENKVPNDVVATWFQSEVKRRGLEERFVTVFDVAGWAMMPEILQSYRVGMDAYDPSVRLMTKFGSSVT